MSPGRLSALLLLLFLFATLTFGGRRLSITADEPVHLAAGYTVLARGLQGLWTVPIRGHPLLVNAWEALPIFIGHPDIPLENLPGWRSDLRAYSTAFISSLDNLERAEIAGRTGEMLLTLLLAAVLFRWADDLWGTPVALLTLSLFIFDPTLLAHGRMATNDIGVTALGTLTLLVARRWWKRPRWKTVLPLGALLAATMLAKISGVLWPLAFGLGTLWQGRTRKHSGAFWLQALLIAATTGLFVWAAYGFSTGKIEALPSAVPFPQHWQALLRQGQSPDRRITFALGMRHRGNRWWYYPLTFVLKNPLPLLLSLTLGCAALIRHPAAIKRHIPTLIFPAVYTAAAICCGANVGYRHMLPVQPFLYLLASRSLSRWAGEGVLRLTATTGLVLWHIIGTCSIFPDEIAYFNELIGGPSQGYRYLVDSNVDWGQSFEELRHWLDDHPDGKPAIAHMTFVSPARYGIEFTPIPPTWEAPPLPTPFQPPPGRYIIGATHLQGIVGHQPIPAATWWFRQAEPVAKVGYSLFVYDVEPYRGTWVAQCITPTVPLADSDIKAGFGDETVERSLYFDCLHSWIYPGGDDWRGWYIFHGHLFAPDGWAQRLLYAPPRAADPFLRAHLTALDCSYRKNEAGDLPPLAIYRPPTPPLPPSPVTVHLGEAAGDVRAISSGPPTDSPIPLNGPLTFLGAQATLHDGQLEVTTIWEINTHPITRPFSVMAHLLSPDGDTLGIGDGFGIAITSLETGDIVAQRHTFTGHDLENDWLRIGAYRLDDMERWPLAVPDRQADAIFIPVKSLVTR